MPSVVRMGEGQRVTRGPGRHRLHQLDGLRAVAALLVIVHHSASSSVRETLTLHGHPALGLLFYATTQSGVELFFVLSGVVLLRPYVRGERALDVRSYFRRRLERIAPPYLGAWLLAGAAAAVWTATPSWFSAHLHPFTVRTWLAQAFIVRFQDVLFNDAWWSLAVEVLFYVLAPLVVVLWSARRLRLGAGFAVLALVMAASTFIAAAARVDHLPLAMLYSLGVYASCFCGGVLVARFDVSPRAAAGLCAAGVAWILAAAWVPWLNIHVGYGLLYTGVVQRLVASVRPGFISSPLAVWLGERSYSLFLVHVSVFQLVDHAAAHLIARRSAMWLVVTRVVGLPAALLVAMLLFWVVERRFARGLVTADAFWPRPGRGVGAGAGAAPVPAVARGSP